MELYEKLFGLKEPVDVEAGLKDGSLVCAPAVSGSEYEQSALRLMYVGRDLNGWPVLKGSTPAELAEYVLTHGREKANEFLYNAVNDFQFRNDDGSLAYSIMRSPFWQVCCEIMNQSGEGDAWAERIVWSNVYKITPSDGHARDLPGFWSMEEFGEHFRICVDILKEEIEFFRPNHIVFITGASHFRPVDLGSSYEPVFSLDEDPDNGYFSIIGKGYYTDRTNRRIKIVAATRPDNPHRKGTRHEQAAMILEAFHSL